MLLEFLFCLLHKYSSPYHVPLGLGDKVGRPSWGLGLTGRPDIQQVKSMR